MSKLRILLISLCLVLKSSLLGFEDGLRLAWDYAASGPISNGVYARMKPLQDGRWMLAYSEGPGVHVRTSKLAGGESFSSSRLVATSAGYISTNAELLQLANGWIVVAYNARPTSANRGILPYQIRTIISRDGGVTWTDERIVYTAGKDPSVGCWEPALIQLPGGELLIFFANEFPYPSSDEQEIGLMRSSDHGLTWGNYTRTSLRAGTRDGMPVPLLLADGETLVHAIEDNGLSGNRFKPAIIASTLSDLWSGGAVGATSPDRWGALRDDVALIPEIYAGAPYLVRLPHGETVLSVQSNEGRGGFNETQAMPRVYLGTPQARDFARGSIPLPWLPATASANWSSLAVTSPVRVSLVSSVRGVSTVFGDESLWLMQARILKPITIAAATPMIDGTMTSGEWSDSLDDAPVFIGAYRDAQLSAYARADATNLYLSFAVNDPRIWTDSPVASGGNAWDDDGVEVLLDPGNVSSPALAPGCFKVLIDAGGDTALAKTGPDGSWGEWSDAGLMMARTVDGTPNNNADRDVGYTIELALPWSSLGGRPADGSGWGIHFRHHDDRDGGAADSHEDLGGNDPDRPATWTKAMLSNGVAQLVNLSVRAEAGSDPLIIGFVSSSEKAVLLRGVGPSLTTILGVEGTMADPRLDIYNGQTVVATNDNWGDNDPGALRAAFAKTGAFGLESVDSLDAAALYSVSGSCTAHVRGPNGGIVLVEVYDRDIGSGGELLNVSARNFCGTGDDILIVGFVVLGGAPLRLLVRGIGPGLSALHVPLPLGDPILSVYRGNTVIATNDNWGGDPETSAAFAESGAFELESTSADAALVLSLSPGSYTAHVIGKGGSTGEALVEVYALR